MDKNYFLATIFIAIFALIGGIYFFYQKPKNSTIYTSLSSPSTIEESPNMNDQLKIEDEVAGTGAEAVAGKKVTVNYVGSLTNGTKFDSSYDRGIPFSFNLGAGEVIQGWDQGIVGMKVGGKRKLIIPPSLGYGASGVGGVIPGNATLIFEVELLNVE